MNDDTEDTPSQQRGLVPWKPGQSGNPKGRPKGSRNKVNEAFIQDFFEAWQALGRQALLSAAWQDPVAFVKVAASLLPKEYKIETSVDLTDEQLDKRIRDIIDGFGDALGIAPGTGRSSQREETPARPH